MYKTFKSEIFCQSFALLQNRLIVATSITNEKINTSCSEKSWRKILNTRTNTRTYSTFSSSVVAYSSCNRICNNSSYGTLTLLKDYLSGFECVAVGLDLGCSFDINFSFSLINPSNRGPSLMASVTHKSEASPM